MSLGTDGSPPIYDAFHPLVRPESSSIRTRVGYDSPPASETLRREPMSRHSQPHLDPFPLRSVGADVTVAAHDDESGFIFDPGNLIGDFDFTRVGDAAQTPVMWSGSLNDDDLWAPEPRNWLGHGLQSLESRLEEIATRPTTPKMTSILLVPHARHVLNDAHGTRLFLDRWDHDLIRVGLALWPWGLFEPSMAEHAEDHLQRILETLMPYAEVLLVGNACVGPSPDDPVVAAPLAAQESSPILPASTYLHLLDQFKTVSRPNLRRCLWIGSDDESDLNTDRDLLRRHSADSI